MQKILCSQLSYTAGRVLLVCHETTQWATLGEEGNDLCSVQPRRTVCAPAAQHSSKCSPSLALDWNSGQPFKNSDVSISENQIHFPFCFGAEFSPLFFFFFKPTWYLFSSGLYMSILQKYMVTGKQWFKFTFLAKAQAAPGSAELSVNNSFPTFNPWFSSFPTRMSAVASKVAFRLWAVPRSELNSPLLSLRLKLKRLLPRSSEGEQWSKGWPEAHSGRTRWFLVY